MADLEFRDATQSDHEFVWDTYARNTMPLIKQDKAKIWENDKESQAFAKRWNAKNTRIITVDGENVGWFSWTVTNTHLIIDNLHILNGNRGIRSLVLGIIVRQATKKDKKASSCWELPAIYEKVSLLLVKNDPASEVFRKEGFPVVKELDAQLQIDVSNILNHSHLSWS